MFGCVAAVLAGFGFWMVAPVQFRCPVEGSDDLHTLIPPKKPSSLIPLPN